MCIVPVRPLPSLLPGFRYAPLQSEPAPTVFLRFLPANTPPRAVDALRRRGFQPSEFNEELVYWISAPLPQGQGLVRITILSDRQSPPQRGQIPREWRVAVGCAVRANEFNKNIVHGIPTLALAGPGFSGHNNFLR